MDSHCKKLEQLEEATNYTWTGKKSANKSLTQGAVIKYYSIVFICIWIIFLFYLWTFQRHNFLFMIVICKVVFFNLTCNSVKSYLFLFLWSISLLRCRQ